MEHSPTQKHIVIVGAGFAGVRAALDLLRENIPHAKITLINSRYHFEYTPALYRVVTGNSPLEVCVPLSEIFSDHDKRIEVVIDTITDHMGDQKKVVGASGSEYHYDFLVLALGSETAYFNIPGLKENSFGFKSIAEALRLKNHLHTLFENHHTLSPEEQGDNLRVVIVGGGPAGVELAGKLAEYGKILAKRHGMDVHSLEIILIEGASRLLPSLPEEVSKGVVGALAREHVKVILGTPVAKVEKEKVFLPNQEFATKTIVWSAGIKVNSLYDALLPNVERNKQGRIIVDEYLRPQGKEAQENIFVAGDAAATPYSGLAQTANHDGAYIARMLARLLRNRDMSPYIPKKVAYALPIGSKFTAFVSGKSVIFGLIAKFIREAADFRFFLSILPFGKAMRAFQEGKKVCEACATCNPPAGGRG